MAFTVVIKEEAHQETIEAFNYYEQKQPGLGERFLESLQERYHQLSEHPANYSYIEEDPEKVLRDIQLKKFPYVVVFEIIGTEVIVYAIHNTYRHSGHKLRKA